MFETTVVSVIPVVALIQTTAALSGMLTEHVYGPHTLLHLVLGMYIAGCKTSKIHAGADLVIKIPFIPPECPVI